MTDKTDSKEREALPHEEISNFTIHKHQVERIGEPFFIETNEGAQPLDMQHQHGSGLVFWLRVDTKRPIQSRRFIAVGTGHQCPCSADYVGTAQDPHTGFVWHLFAF